MDTQADPNPEVLFRPVKRRKFLRRRPEEANGQQASQASEEGSAAPRSPQDGGESVQPIDATRLRRLHRSRKGGIEFSTTSRLLAGQGNNKTSLSSATAEDLEGDRLLAMCDRFTAHTGQTVDVDKHMMAYIESEMAKRYGQGAPGDAPGHDASAPSAAYSSLSSSNLPPRQPASLGKLHEIDLGQETKLQNIARTAAATRRLNGDEEGFSLSGVSLLEKEENSYRNRKRRTSEDIERDRLVEEVLRESKLDVYDEPEEEEEEEVDDQAADDRVADQFRRDFLDAIQSRRRRARNKTTKPRKPEVRRGPKLGGSRSARAAMREMLGKAGRK
ncbi:hypothetical protein ARAM_001956 [Aspergillus rambellii]|uniref:Hepatocellular carcinoma-associated antigen 59-domain-containing protein n=1 Tax=Aspergillus rambellii TaxID=308745 RepID=A0A0F8X436_9EURO|nr:hypothetical protein ARAM_001956 [Aspergillus rambellii]